MPGRFFIIRATLALGMATMAGAAIASEPAVELDQSISVENAVPGPTESGATPIEPDRTVTDPRPHPWDSILVSSDGRALAIYFWMGHEECSGLHSVSASPTASGIEVRLLSRQPADMVLDTACIEIAQSYVTTVALEQPLITNAG